MVVLKAHIKEVIMFLSEVDIKKFIEKGIIEVNPQVSEENFRPCGIRVHLSPIIYEFLGSVAPIDMREGKRMGNKDLHEKSFKEVDLQSWESEEKSYILKPGKTVIGSTLEQFKMPNYMVGFLDGRSTISRFGITNNITSSLVDNMDSNKPPQAISLAISNCGGFDFVLWPRLPIGMLLFSILSSRTRIFPPDQQWQYPGDYPLPNIDYNSEEKIP
jgi:dCTP deaminase